MIVKFTDNFLMIRGLITVLSALKMRNFTRIFLSSERGGGLILTIPRVKLRISTVIYHCRNKQQICIVLSFFMSLPFEVYPVLIIRSE